MAQLPLIRQNQAANAHIDGATPSYLPTSINQPNQNMPHRSELSQGRRQNHQERHQSCPKTGGKTTRKDIRVVPFWDIDGATSVILPKSGWECPHDGATPGVAPSISQKSSLMLRKKNGEKPAQKIAKICHFRDIDGSTALF